MTQWDKLIARILSLSDDLRFEELKKVLECYGYAMKAPRGGGSHRTFRKPGADPITIPIQRPVKRLYVECVAAVVIADREDDHDDQD